MLSAIQIHYLVLPTCKGIEVIDIADIIRIKAISNYSKLIFANGKTLVVAKLLRWFEAKLPADQFIRIHRTHIVNKNFIQQRINGKTDAIKMSNGELIDVSRRKKIHFFQRWYNPVMKIDEPITDMKTCLIDQLLWRKHKLSIRDVFTPMAGDKGVSVLVLSSTLNDNGDGTPYWHLLIFSISLNASLFTQLLSGKPAAHPNGVTFFAICHPGSSTQSRYFLRFTLM
jgi:LytTr DNA-binding domain